MKAITDSTTARRGCDNSPLVDELAALFGSIDDSKLIARLWQYRWTGRRGYPPRSLWRAVIAGHYLNIGSTIGLTRRLQEDSALLAACGLHRVPSRLTIVERLFSRLKGHRALTRHTRRRLAPRVAPLYPGDPDDAGLGVGPDSIRQSRIHPAVCKVGSVSAPVPN